MKVMQKFETIMNNYFLPFATKLAEQKHLQSIKDGLLVSLPLVIVGSFFLVFGFLPIPGYNEFMAKIFGEAWLEKFLYPVSVTFDIVSIFAALGIGYYLAKKNKVDPLSAAVISLATFLLVTPNKIFVADTSVSGYSMAFLGGKGLFVAIICALISTELYSWFIKKNYIIKMPESCPPAVAKSFSALIPAFVIIAMFWIIKIGVEATNYQDVHQLVVKLISDPLTGFSATLAGGIIYVLINSLFWSFGIHGGSIAGIVFGPMLTVIRDVNRLAFQNGEPIPYTISLSFLDTYVFIGGSGATLCLVLCYLFYSKAKQYKEIGKLSIGAALFNINEPVIFGSPIVLNPILIVPFILTPVILTVVDYILIEIGLVAPAVIPVPWTMPVVISGFLTSGGHISGALVQILNIFIGLVIYLPFVKLLDKKAEIVEIDNFDNYESEVA